MSLNLPFEQYSSARGDSLKPQTTIKVTFTGTPVSTSAASINSNYCPHATLLLITFCMQTDQLQSVGRRGFQRGFVEKETGARFPCISFMHKITIPRDRFFHPISLFTSPRNGIYIVTADSSDMASFQHKELKLHD